MDKELRILILEDVPTDAELLELELRKGGIPFSSICVETKEDFLKELKEFAPDIILSDYKLPNFDGMAALELTKELAPTIPFIIVTGSMNEETAVECMKAGAADYVIKDHLIRIGPAVKEALENKKVKEEKARLEEALWTSAREWRTTFDAVNYPVALMDLEGRIRRCNKAMANLLGRPFSEIIGHNCCSMIHGRPGLIEGCPIVRMRETNRREILELSLGNQWFNIVADPLPDEDGSLIGAVHIMSDITERRRMEESLRVSHRFLEIANRHTNMNSLLNEFVVEVQRFTQCAAAGIRILDKGGNIPYQAYKGFDQRFYESESPLSIKSDQCMCINVIKGVTYPKLPFYTEGGSFYMNGTTRFLATVSEEEKGKTRNVCNQVGYESVALVPIRIGGGILGLIHVADPYENMVPLETVETLEQVAMQLGEALQHLRADQEMADLQEQLRQSQKMEAIGQLAGGIAHDFNNLLTVIKGYSQLSLLRFKEGDPSRGNLEEIKNAVDKAADLTRQLLAFSRRQILDHKVLDLNIVLRNLEKMLHRVIGEDIELMMHLPEGLGRVKTDPGQIEQVIMNLAVNAKDAMLDGGKLVIETANVELDETYARNHVAVTPGRYVMVSVSDSGIGMTPEIKEKVFEPFFTTKKKGEGTGLGLSTVYGIVKQSGGYIWVYSEVGKGTTLKIYLPRVDEPLGEIRKEEVVREGLPRGSETILVVEDEEVVRKLAVRILEEQGYRVLEGGQGIDAFPVADEHEGPINLLVTDVVMPKMSGREVADRLASLRPEIKVLYMSGYTDNVIFHHGILEEGINFIQKPFTLEGLARKVREVLDK